MRLHVAANVRAHRPPPGMDAGRESSVRGTSAHEFEAGNGGSGGAILLDRRLRPIGVGSCSDPRVPRVSLARRRLSGAVAKSIERIGHDNAVDELYALVG